jgi:hypothetical protein
MLGTVNIKVRPLRFAFLVDPNNALQVRKSIKLACSLWGGMFFPVIPVYLRIPSSLRSEVNKPDSAEQFVRGYIEAFDPDMLVQFCTRTPEYLKNLPIRIIKPSDVWRSGARVETHQPIHGLGVFDLLLDVFKECFKYNPRYPTRIAIPSIPSTYSIFWASVFGEYDDHVSAEIEREFAKHLDIDRPEVAPNSFKQLTDPSILFPRRLTCWGITTRRQSAFGNTSCVFYMDATSVEDVVDYWNLRASGRSVMPLPKQFAHVESFRQSIEEFLIELGRDSKRDNTSFPEAAFIRSRNSSMDEMTVYAKSLQFASVEATVKPSDFYSLQHSYPRFWDEWSRNHDGGVCDTYTEDEDSFDLGKSPSAEMKLKPLLPRFVDKHAYRSEAVCINEFDFGIYGADEFFAEVYPRSAGKNVSWAISNLGEEWRIGRHGLVRPIGRHSAQSQSIPSSEKVFFAWLLDRGWKAELSASGILAKQIYKQLGGYPWLISKKSVLGLIEHMNGGATARDGSPKANSGQALNDRALSVGEVKNKLQTASENNSFYDSLIAKGIFKLGLGIKCPNCLRGSWYALPSIIDTMECPKCLQTFRAVGTIEQTTPNWQYRTTGPFSVPNYAEGAYAVLIALNALSDRWFISSRTTCVTSFNATSPNNRHIEADFAMLHKSIGANSTEELVFGESKTYGLFDKTDFDRMRLIAKEFPGAILVFSTLRDSLSPREVTMLRSITKSGRKYWKPDRPINPVLILTGNELFDGKAPPDCWGDDAKEKFKNVNDLLSLCDATQQRYLGLDSWHTDWESKWKKKAELRRKRNPKDRD